MAVQVAGPEPQRQLAERHGAHVTNLQGRVRGDAQLRAALVVGGLWCGFGVIVCIWGVCEVCVGGQEKGKGNVCVCVVGVVVCVTTIFFFFLRGLCTYTCINTHV